MSVRDPRTIVTPYAFRVAPDLLGLPLAGPTRRALGILIDLTLIGMLALAGWTASLTFLFVIFIVHLTSKERRFGHPLVRVPVRILAALLLVGAIVGRPVSWIRSTLGDAAVAELASLADDAGVEGGLTIDLDDGGVTTVDPATLLRAGADAIRFARTEDTLEARRLAGGLAAELQRQGLPPAEIAEVLGQFGADSVEAPAKWRAVLRETSRLDSIRLERSASEDSLLKSYAEAMATDSARARLLRPDVVEALSGDSIRELRQRLSETTSELAETRAELEEQERGFSFLSAARNLAEDLGVGFGLSGIYFTVFTVWWRGQTPGKRIVGERVVKLNGRPMSWWDSFNRFGGYAAGLATGTLGFLELIWDANRQAAHDKMVGTVVLRTRATGVSPTEAAASVAKSAASVAESAAKSTAEQTEPEDAASRV